MTQEALLALLPCLKHVDEHHAAQKVALTLEVCRFISDTRDGSFAFSLWDQLKDLPDVIEHVERMREVNLLFSQHAHDSQFKLAVGSAYSRTIAQLIHEAPLLVEQVFMNSKPAGGAL